MRRLGLALLLGPAAAWCWPAPAAADEPLMFTGSVWVCDTPEHYDDAVAQQRSGGDLKTLRRDLLAANRCIFVADEDQNDILPPFVSLLEEQNGKAKVSFMIRTESRQGLLDRRISQTRYVGWTDERRVETREAWRKILQ